MIANIMMQPGVNKGIDENQVRHMIINSLRGYNVKFGKKYGELVICSDSANYWRKEYFPYYKAARKKTRAASDVDWTTIFLVINKVREEIKEVFPWRVIELDLAEADDIIGAMCIKHGVRLNTENTEKMVIVSTDKDFLQLQKYVNVEQYSPTAKKFIYPDGSPQAYLLEHLIRGDKGDGIPNILSKDDTFVVTGARQGSIMQKKLDVWLSQTPEEFCDEEMLINYNRNKKLIDLSMIPPEVMCGIYNAYETAPKRDRSKLFNYFIQHRMKELMPHLQEF
jgi:hypothetical protein